MVKNSTVVKGHWYRHPGMLDTAIYVADGDHNSVVVNWYNISGGKRKFYMHTEFFMLTDFERSPYWVDQGEWIEDLPRLFG